MSDYDFRPGGSLKLKGGVSDGGVVKKKKKSKSSKVEKELERERANDKVAKDSDTKANSPSGSGRNSPAVAGSSDRKTEAEKRFEAIQRERMAKRVAKLATKTHKDRVNEFNSKLEALSEHHDIPKVGPG